MPRSISTSLRRKLEEPNSNEYLIVLLEINHQSLATPIRVVNDVVDYVYDEDIYTGFPFEFELLGDLTQVPRGRLKIQNVDRSIGQAILELTDPPTLTITILASSDFDETLSNGRRVPAVEDPVIEYQATNLIFGNISVDAMAIAGDIQSFDMGSEPWPAVRATADRLPGLDP